VVVVVLNWNNISDTLECLDSLACSDYKDLRTWVVDNGSSQDPTSILQTRHPSARILRNTENLGYGGGNNVGLREAIASRATYVLLLNNDATVAPDTVSRLVAAADADQQIGMATPVVFYHDRPTEVYWDGGFIDWDSGETWHDSHRFAAEGNVRPSEWLDGCSLLVRTAALRDVGLLDERYFLYFEDAEWSIRSGRRGWKNVVVLDARVWHKVSRSTGGKGHPAVQFYYARNRFFFLRAHSPSASSISLKRRYARRLLREYRALLLDRQGRRAIILAALSIWRGHWGSFETAGGRSHHLIGALDIGGVCALKSIHTLRRAAQRVVRTLRRPARRTYPSGGGDTPGQ
jgi:GT2 family glycosyltransferase